MSMGDQDRRTGTPSSFATSEAEPGVPLITWVLGGAALLVVLTAGALFFDVSPDVPPREEEGSAPPPTSALEAAPAPAIVTPKNPLEITASFLDAQERARLWNPGAVLSGIELVIEAGQPVGAVTFEFGAAVGRAVPGAPVSPRRHKITYEKNKVGEESFDSHERRVGLPEPNCPLEVAFRSFEKSGAATEGRIGVIYAQSKKHGRPVWMMTNEKGAATSLNADSCALLLR